MFKKKVKLHAKDIYNLPDDDDSIHIHKSASRSTITSRDKDRTGPQTRSKKTLMSKSVNVLLAPGPKSSRSQKSVGFAPSLASDHPPISRTPSPTSSDQESRFSSDEGKDPNQRYRVRYKSRRDKKCIMNKFDVSDMYTEIVIRQALTESSSESTETRMAREAQEHLTRCYKCKRWGQTWLDVSSDEEENCRAGYWDYWTPYYCMLREPTEERMFNYNYLTWLFVYLIAHNRQMELVYACHRNGGMAFILVLCIVYFAVGYPMMCLETLVGQFSGRKPVRAFRYLCPILGGISIALYARTFMLVVHAIGFVVYASVMIFDFFFCTLNSCRLLQDFGVVEKKPYTFTQLGGYVSWEEADIWRENVFMIYVFGYTIYNLNKYDMDTFSYGMRVGLRVLFAVGMGALFVHYGRILRHLVPPSSLMFAPVWNVLTPTWDRVWYARTWANAVVYVFQTTGICSLVHPYLGAKLGYHYNSARDILIVLVLTMMWSMFSAMSIILWMGYVVNTEVQMNETLHQFQGVYSLYITVPRKSNQASLIGRIDPESNFFIGFHYSIHGLMAVLYATVLIHVLIHCSYSDHAPPLLKKFLFYFYIFIFIGLIPVILLLAQGLRHLMFYDYYMMTSPWPIIMMMASIFYSVAYGHSLVKFVYDVRNILRLRAFGPFAFNPIYTYFTRIFVCWGVMYVLLWIPTQSLWPITPRLDYNTSYTITVGFLISSYPLYGMFLSAFHYFYTTPREKWTIKAHWNWYKNHSHFMECFYNHKKEVVLDIVKRCRAWDIKSRVHTKGLMESNHVRSRVHKPKKVIKKKKKRFLDKKRQSEQEEVPQVKIKKFRIFERPVYKEVVVKHL